MLTFKKGTYTKEQLAALYDALCMAQLTICKRVVPGLCDTCPYDRPCKDLTNVLEYIATLTPERWTSK